MRLLLPEVVEVEVRAASHRRALAPIHHLSCQASVMGVARKCPQLWERKEDGEKMEKSYCTRCGHRLQELQIILEMHKKAGSPDS